PRDGSVVSSLHCMNDPQPEGHMASYIARRKFLATLLGGAAAWPLAARAQQADRIHRVAIISPSAPVTEMIEAGDHPAYQALFNELDKLGYVEGRNLIVERYSAEGRPERSTDLTQMVVRTQPDLILTVGNLLVRSLKVATNMIPIVASVADPVAYGLVANLAHPDANFTGISLDAGLEIW